MTIDTALFHPLQATENSDFSFCNRFFKIPSQKTVNTDLPSRESLIGRIYKKFISSSLGDCWRTQVIDSLPIAVINFFPASYQAIKSYPKAAVATFAVATAIGLHVLYPTPSPVIEPPSGFSNQWILGSLGLIGVGFYIAYTKQHQTTPQEEQAFSAILNTSIQDITDKFTTVFETACYKTEQTWYLMKGEVSAEKHHQTGEFFYAESESFENRVKKEFSQLNRGVRFINSQKKAIIQNGNLTPLQNAILVQKAVEIIDSCFSDFLTHYDTNEVLGAEEQLSQAEKKQIFSSHLQNVSSELKKAFSPS